MRGILCHGLVALSVLSATMVAAPPASVAADLDRHYTGRACPSYFGTQEDWSVKDERPPRKGYWYYTSRVTPGVNFLVPIGCAAGLRPAAWTPAWYDYCTRRWPSFNPRTGMIETPDGVRMCV